VTVFLLSLSVSVCVYKHPEAPLRDDIDRSMNASPSSLNSVAHESETRNVNVRGIVLFTHEFDDFTSSLSSSQPVAIRAP
jgi:hypothetical protein